MTNEFLSSIAISSGIPLAIFFSVRLKSGGFTTSGHTKTGFVTPKIVINKHSLVGLGVAILDLLAGILN